VTVTQRARGWLGLLVVAGAGALIGHEVGYTVGPSLGSQVVTPHGHVAQLLQILPPLGGFVLLAAAVSDPRRARWAREQLTVGRLAAVQMLLFVALEVMERQAHGVSLAELATPPVLVGAVAQLLVAALLVTFVRRTRRALQTLTSTPSDLPRCGPAVRVVHVAWPVRAAQVAGQLGSRAPPLPLLH
jgi:hypothetical protein